MYRTLFLQEAFVHSFIVIIHRYATRVTKVTKVMNTSGVAQNRVHCKGVWWRSGAPPCFRMGGKFV